MKIQLRSSAIKIRIRELILRDKVVRACRKFAFASYEPDIQTNMDTDEHT